MIYTNEWLEGQDPLSTEDILTFLCCADPRTQSIEQMIDTVDRKGVWDELHAAASAISRMSPEGKALAQTLDMEERFFRSRRWARYMMQPENLFRMMGLGSPDDLITLARTAWECCLEDEFYEALDDLKPYIKEAAAQSGEDPDGKAVKAAYHMTDLLKELMDTLTDNERKAREEIKKKEEEDRFLRLVGLG